MRELDETDMEILQLLIEDARRPYSEIADIVGLSPPAVSDRVTRLQEAGVIRRFTLDVDRSQLQEGVAVLVDLRASPTAVDAIGDALRAADAVEHVFTAAESHVVAVARLPGEEVREWLTETVDVGALEGYEVTLLSDAEWTPSLSGTAFALTCAECGNTVTNEGVGTHVDGTLHHFCCTSCEARFQERYETLREGTD